MEAGSRVPYQGPATYVHNLIRNAILPSTITRTYQGISVLWEY
jgi:hypothetical protein